MVCWTIKGTLDFCHSLKSCLWSSPRVSGGGVLLSRTAAGKPVDIKGRSKYFCLVAQTCQITEKDILNFLITSRRQRKQYESPALPCTCSCNYEPSWYNKITIHGSRAFIGEMKLSCQASYFPFSLAQRTGAQTIWNCLPTKWRSTLRFVLIPNLVALSKATKFESCSSRGKAGIQVFLALASTGCAISCTKGYPTITVIL